MKKKTKIAFLDRDGVINSSKINNGYVGFIKDFKWIKGSKKATHEMTQDLKFQKKKKLDIKRNPKKS